MSQTHHLDQLRLPQFLHVAIWHVVLGLQNALHVLHRSLAVALPSHVRQHFRRDAGGVVLLLQTLHHHCERCTLLGLLKRLLDLGRFAPQQIDERIYLRGCELVALVQPQQIVLLQQNREQSLWVPSVPNILLFLGHVSGRAKPLAEVHVVAGLITRRWLALKRRHWGRQPPIKQRKQMPEGWR